MASGKTKASGKTRAPGKKSKASSKAKASGKATRSTSRSKKSASKLTTDERRLLELMKARDWNAVFELNTTPLVEFGPDVLQEAIVRSALSRDVSIVDNFRARGADVNGSWNTYTLLSTASGLGDPDFVRKLLIRGANVNLPGYDEGTPLICACRVGNQWLEPAVRRYTVRVAKVLLEAKAAVNRKDLYGKTALDYAYEAWWPEMARLLHDHKASVKACDEKGARLLYWAITQPGSTKMLQLYLDHGGSPNLDVGLGVTALQHAQQAGWSSKVRLLRKYGAK